MKLLDSSVGKNNTLVHFVLGLLIFAFFSTFQNPLPILGMKPAIPKFSIRRILIRAAAEDSMDFRRDCDYPRCNIKLPAARVA